MPAASHTRPGTALVSWADADTVVLADPRRRVPRTGETMVRVCVHGDSRDPWFPSLIASYRLYGELVPLFRREVAEAVVAWCNTEHRANPSYDHAWWEDDTIVVHTPGLVGELGYVPDRVRPDGYGRYAIGAGSWWWQPAVDHPRTAASTVHNGG